MWISLLRQKSDAFTAFKNFKSLAEVEKGVKIKMLRTDRGGEFNSIEFDNFCVQQGIKRQLNARYSPQQNGVVERRNRTIMSLVRSMLKGANLPQEYWGEAASTSVYLLNRAPTRSLVNSTPYEMWTGRKPNVSHFKVFGCLAHILMQGGKKKKLEDRSKPMIFLGYELGTKAYRFYDLVGRRLHISRDAVFQENEVWTWNSNQG